MNGLYAKYRGRVEFYLVYIREAHPTDGRQVPANVREQVLVKTPTTLGERREVLATCAVKLDIRFPALVDGIDNAVEQAYAAWPDRIYVVGTDGRIAYKGGPGPRGFRVDELSHWLATHVGD